LRRIGSDAAAPPDTRALYGWDILRIMDSFFPPICLRRRMILLGSFWMFFLSLEKVQK
jgi:hypothetical protein